MMQPFLYRDLRYTTLLLVVSVAMAFAPDAYLPMLARAFMLPISLTLLLISGLARWKKYRWTSITASFGAVLTSGQAFTPVLQMSNKSAGPSIHVFHMNVLQPNHRFDEAIKQALDSGADVISVQEVGEDWADALRTGLCGTYPFAQVIPGARYHGIALFSKHPFTQVRTMDLVGTPVIEALFEVECEPIRLITVHATSPVSYDHFRQRNEQFETLAQHLVSSDTATIVVGDLNTVPWDKAYQRFCHRTGLCSTTPLQQRTWPSIGPLAFIPLDHVLISNGLSIRSLTTVHVPGSDHRGLLAEIQLPFHAR